MEVVGKVIQVLPIQKGIGKASGKEWQSLSFIIETQEQYPRKVCCEIFGEDKIQSNPVAVDEIVTVSFDLESREYNGRWYTSVRVWKVAKGASASAAPQNNAAAAPMGTGSANTGTFDNIASTDDGTDLPF